MEDGIKSLEILCEPRIEEEVAETEKDAACPSDVKEMSLNADEFHGGWHYACR
jgi:hypothetical protein